MVLIVMGETEAHFCLVLIMAESIPSVSSPPPGGGRLSGICHFVLEKLQMPMPTMLHTPFKHIGLLNLFS